jgi:hypothetical protein
MVRISISINHRCFFCVGTSMDDGEETGRDGNGLLQDKGMGWVEQINCLGGEGVYDSVVE